MRGKEKHRGARAAGTSKIRQDGFFHMSKRSIEDPDGSPLVGASVDRLCVAVEENFPPFVHVENDRVAGLAIDLLEAAARRSGVKLEYLPAPASDIPAILAEGKADAAFPMAINPDRLALFDFSKPVLTTGGGLFVAVPFPSPVGLDELSGRTIATPGTGPLANFIRATAPDIALISTSDYIEPLRMVVSGEAAAAALNLEAGSILVEKLYHGRIALPATYFLKLPLALGLPKRNRKKLSVLRRLNVGINSIRDART
jgi:polar amino acid transport system substrate-binding protein